jgi:DNA-binding GntR family transcriptional regulator
LSATAELAVLTPPARETLQERVYGELRAALMRGRFLPGQSLTIRAVAAALRTSSMPVREALRQLVAERALGTLANRSFGVPLITRERFKDLVQVRVEIEGYAAARAASRISPGVIERLDSINKAMVTAERLAERELYIARNQEFHFLVYEAAGSGVLLPVIETLWLQSGPYIADAFSDGPHPKVTLDRHQGLIDALRRGDAVAARKMVAGDITDAAAVILAGSSFSDVTADSDRMRGQAGIDC